MVADAVEQQQRLPGTAAFVRHGHGPGPSGVSTLNETVLAMAVLPVVATREAV